MEYTLLFKVVTTSLESVVAKGKYCTQYLPEKLIISNLNTFGFFCFKTISYARSFIRQQAFNPNSVTIIEVASSDKLLEIHKKVSSNISEDGITAYYRWYGEGCTPLSFESVCVRVPNKRNINKFFVSGKGTLNEKLVPDIRVINLIDVPPGTVCVKSLIVNPYSVSNPPIWSNCYKTNDNFWDRLYRAGKIIEPN